MKKRILIPVFAAAFTLAIVSCDSDTPTALDTLDQGPSFSKVTRMEKVSDDAIRKTMGQINAQLEARAENVRVEMVEWLAPAGSDMVGRTVYFMDVGNKRLSADFVPGDQGRFGTTDIYYAVDATEASTSSGLDGTETEGAIVRAMNTWNNITCSTIPIIQVDVGVQDLGYVQWLFGMGGVPGWLADITHAGWLPRDFFDAVAPDGGDYILGVTFTYVWVDGGVPTDMDNNRRHDVAFREIYYNDNFSWAIDDHYDVETVALHEAGHGLSQGHFGQAFRTEEGGVLHFAPRAVMNAAYSGIQREITETDNAGHCTNWASWPEY